MAHTFYFGNVAKRKNSTLQPTGLNSSYDVLFKTPTSLDNPTITLNYSGDFPFNYAKYGDNYYFVVDRVSKNNDLWEITLELDALATHKAEILATNAYVLYDGVVNTEIPDNRLPMKTTAYVQTQQTACPFTVDSGCYILSLTGAHDTTGIYKVNSSQLADLIDDVSDIKDDLFDFSQLTPPQWPSAPSGSTSIPDWLDFVGQCLGWVGDWIEYAIKCAVRPVSQMFGTGNIPENIRECRFIPFDVGVTGGSQTIYLGTFETQTSLSKLITKTVHRTASVGIPWQASDYRRRSPYTEVYLYMPYIGMTRLSSENLIGVSSLNVDYTLGLLDGSMIVTVSGGGEVIGQYSCNVASSVPVGISNISIPRVAGTLAAGVASALSGNIAGVGLAAIQFGDSVTPNYSCIGGLDGVAATAANQNITCYTVFHDTVVTPNTGIGVIGAPTMSPKSLSALTGYCQCMDAHVAAAADAPTLDKIDNYLNTGFFIE